MTSRITVKDLTPVPTPEALEVATAQEWATKLDVYLPDDELLEMHKAGLHTNDLITRAKYLELAYKLKGKLVEGAGQPVINIQINSNEPI